MRYGASNRCYWPAFDGFLTSIYTCVLFAKNLFPCWETQTTRKPILVKYDSNLDKSTEAAERGLTRRVRCAIVHKNPLNIKENIDNANFEWGPAVKDFPCRCHVIIPLD